MTAGISPSIFGFAEFVAALALLVIVYTVSDVRYRFRIAIAPVPLYELTFGAILFIGAGTLIVDLWYAEGWPTIPGLVGQAGLQAIFGVLFLCVIALWTVVAYLRPPIFGNSNARKYGRALFQYILRGAEADLSVIADELGRSAKALVTLSPESPRRGMPPNAEPSVSKAAGYAHDILLLIGNRKFCRQIAKDSPQTAIEFLDAIEETKRYRVPIGQFIGNVSTEALLNEDSILYHESEEFSSDWIGQVRPFSRALYGNFQLVETLSEGIHSPVDIHWWRGPELRPPQWKTYSMALQTLIKASLVAPVYGDRPYSIIQGFHVMEHLTADLYTLTEVTRDVYDKAPYEKLDIAVEFIDRIVKMLEDEKVKAVASIKTREKGYRPFDLYDELADLAFEIVFDASAVSGDSDKCWSIHHNAVWSRLNGLTGGYARRQLQKRLHRRLYDEIRRMDRYLNYKGARILAILLNVEGLTVGERKGYRRESYPLRRVMLAWVKANYLRLRDELPDVADACLVGGITFDAENSRLVKTYAKGLSREPAREYLDLDPFITP